MRSRRPSPSLVISVIALVMATTGTAVAAVSYATNAGAVDGKSAHSAQAPRARVAGDLVATERRGPQRGRIPGRFLADVMRGGADSFSRPAEVADNAADIPTPVASVPGLGTLSASCYDQEPSAGVEDAASTLTFANASGVVIDVARQTGGFGPVLFSQAPATTSSFAIAGSTTFRLHIERQGTNYVLEGAVLQSGADTPAASCKVYGYALRVADVA